MKPPLGKRRTREHVIADLGECFVEWQVLQCGHVVERMHRDYGIDMELKVFNEGGQLESGDVLIQVKATESLALRSGQTAFSVRVERANLVDWVYELQPVVLIAFDARKKRGYWVCIQEIFGDPTLLNFFGFGKSVSVRIPIANRLNPTAIRKIVQLRDRFRR
jgi:uncharacterized protein DUF4365